MNKTPATMSPAAAPPPSISWDPKPQSHSGSRTPNGRPSGTWPGQVTLAPPARKPLVTVVQPLRPHAWPYEAGTKTVLLSAPAR